MRNAEQSFVPNSSLGFVFNLPPLCVLRVCRKIALISHLHAVPMDKSPQNVNTTTQHQLTRNFLSLCAAALCGCWCWLLLACWFSIRPFFPRRVETKKYRQIIETTKQCSSAVPNSEASPHARRCCFRCRTWLEASSQISCIVPVQHTVTK
jgi:hypothetical protein